MVDRSFPGLAEPVRARLEGAGFTPESVARARPSELVRRAGLRADIARRLVAHYRGEAPGAAPFTFPDAGVEGRPVENGESDSGEEGTGPFGAAPSPRAGDEGDAVVAPDLGSGGEGRRWERVWDPGGRTASAGVKWRGRVVLRVALLRRL